MLMLLSCHLVAFSQEYSPWVGSFTITNVATGQRLDGNYEKAIYPLAPNKGYYQKWDIYVAGQDSGGKYYYLKNFETKLYLTGIWGDLIGSPDKNNLTKWYMEKTGKYYRFTNKFSKERLDGNYNDVYLLAPNDGNYQKWKLVDTRD